MTLLSPYGLLAAAAILLPIAIHLWNKRQGKTVKVGSLRWLEASASKRWSSIKLNNIWLLLLRCCIFILLAVALAAPFRVGAPTEKPNQKAVYLSEELLYSSSLATLKPTIDQLLLRGYTLHRYTPAFEAIPPEQWQSISSSPTDSLTGSGSHWSLLPALVQRYQQPQDSVWLFTSDQQRHFAGKRPTAIPANIRWIPVALEAPAAWVHSAARTGPDTLQLVLAQSTREGTRYSRHQSRISPATPSIPLPNGQQAQLTRQGNNFSVGLNNGTGSVAVRTEPLRYALYSSDEQQSEVRYLQAAVRAISRYTGTSITLSKATEADTTTADMIFWLQDAPVPENLLQQVQQGTELWVQPGTDATATPAVLANTGADINIEKISTPTTAEGITLWETSIGEPLLTEQPVGKGKIYYFRSGFGPAWSQLGQSAHLPELLLPVFLPDKQLATYDARALPEEELQLPTYPVTAAPDVPTEEQFPLWRWFVAAAFALFVLERILSSRKINS